MGKRREEVFRLIGIGWYIAICILLGTLGGRWLGQRLDGKSYEVLFTLLGLFLGLSVAVLGVYRMLRLVARNNPDNGKGNH